jgi:hypothetical protein
MNRTIPFNSETSIRIRSRKKSEFRSRERNRLLDHSISRLCQSLPELGREGEKRNDHVGKHPPTHPPLLNPHPTPHLHHHTSCRHGQTPRFRRERFSSPGGGKSIQPPDPKPCFLSPTNLSYSRPAEQDTWCLSPRAQETPSELPIWIDDPIRHRQHRHVAGAVLVSRWASGLASLLRVGAAAEGDVDYRTAQSPPPPHPLHPTPH